MNELILLKNNDVFTTSLVIAESTGNQHKSVVALVKKHIEYFRKFGSIEFSDLKSLKRGRPTKVYYLNEQQATLLMTFLDNSEVVIEFKVELVKQFYQMRQILLEKQTALWQNTRLESKINRLKETDKIKTLVAYAKENGSKNADKYYITFSKLVNHAVGLDSNQRNHATTNQLNNLILIENIINHVIKEGLEQQAHYKGIYKACKERIEQFKYIAYLEKIA
ncbi:Rha family transcriptional regulator [Lachnospiraceae bacterium 46-61]